MSFQNQNNATHAELKNDNMPCIHNAVNCSCYNVGSQISISEIRIDHPIRALVYGGDRNKLFENGNDKNCDRLIVNGHCNDTGEKAMPISVKADEFFIADHGPDTFYVLCNCRDCIQYRGIVIDLLYDDFKFNRCWDIVQTYIRNVYDIIPDDNSAINKKYRALMSKAMSKWCSDAYLYGDNMSLDECISPLASEIAFVRSIKNLLMRDRHQLFQLLCVQVRAITIAYSEGLKEIITIKDGVSEYHPSQLVNFILDGYDKICKSAKTITPFLYELQSNHLEEFSLTWFFLNKRMYYHWVYLEVQKVVPSAICKLKKLVYSEKFKSIVSRFTTFDDDMVLTNEIWKEVAISLHDYDLSKYELDRRRRIASVNQLFKKLKQCSINFSDLSKELFNISELNEMDKADLTVWKNTFNYLKKMWTVAINERLSIDMTPTRCINCKFDLYGQNERDDGQSVNLYCTKCSIFNNIDGKYVNYISKRIYTQTIKKTAESSSECNGENCNEVMNNTNEIYHLSWAIFKHLPNRVPYDYSTINANNFCIFQNQPCSKVSCKVAAHIVAAIYPLNFSKLLIRWYSPVNYNKRPDIIPNHINSFLNKFCDSIKKSINNNYVDIDNGLTDIELISKNQLHNDQIKMLRAKASLFAESCLTNFQFTPDENIYPCFLSLFKIRNNDWELNLDRLDCIYTSKSVLLSHKKIDSCDLKEQISIDCLKSCFYDLEIVSRSLSASPDKLNLAEAEKKTETVISANRIEHKKAEKEYVCIEPSSVEHAAAAENTDDTSKNENWKNEAIKFVVKKKINSKLEAELISLKKEHSALKHMVRDLEQIKEYEEKLNQIKNVKSSNQKPSSAAASHDCQLRDCVSTKEKDENSNGSTKDINRICHRSEGQCVCYYCTIFGVIHSECSRGRTTGTRDRLRKRLNQIQNSKDSVKQVNMKTLKNTSDILKTINSPKSANKNKINKDIEEMKKTVSSLVVDKIDQLKESRKNKKSKFVVTHEEIHKINAKKSNVKTTTTMISPPTVPPPTPVAPVSNVQPNLNSPPTLTKTAGTVINNLNVRQASDTKPPPPPPKDDVDVIGLSSVNELLHFIEGPSDCKVKDVSKKAAKKARQKQRKQEIKTIEQLEELRVEFEQISIRELELKMILKNLKNTKKKDKKKINEYEVKARQVDIEKFEKETVIKEMISLVKESSPEFKFSYQPKLTQPNNSVRQKAQVSNTILQGDKKTTSPLPIHATIQIPPIPPSIAKEYGVSPIVPGQCHMPAVQPSVTGGTNQEGMSETAKRIVTIRRVNLPHTEPQVTVTAKGSTPDKDMLLYTFLNGQLVSTNDRSKTSTNNAKEGKNKGAQQNSKGLQKEKLLKNVSEQSKNTKNSAEDSKSAKEKKKTSAEGKSAIKISESEKCTIQPKKGSKSNSKTQQPSSSSSSTDSSRKTSKAEITPKTNNREREFELEKLVKEINNSSNSTCPPGKVKKTRKPLKYQYCESISESNKFKLLADELSESDEHDESADEAPIATVPKSKRVKTYENNKIKSTSQKSKVSDDTSSSKHTKKTDKITAEPLKSAETKLSKKRREKLKNPDHGKNGGKQQQMENASNDKSINSLSKSIQRLRLNSDTTIELVNSRQNIKNSPENSISIMEQLKLGVNVEGLKLPPGITLTRVDPASAESFKAKKESISQITQPMQQPIDPMISPLMRNSPHGNNPATIIPSMAGLNSNQNGVIMIDTLNIKKNSNSKDSGNANCDNESKKSRKNRNRNNKNDSNENSTKSGGKQPNNNSNNKRQAKIVTLRNPMFQTVSNAFRPNQVPADEINTQPKPPIPVDQPAAIIKNENGMFTIRNPALHQAIQSGLGNNFHQYSSNEQSSMSSSQPPQENFSYFSEQVSAQPANKTYSAAIGSEMKNVQQQRLFGSLYQKCMGQRNEAATAAAVPSQIFDPSMYAFNRGDMYNNYGYNETPVTSPFENQCVYGLNSNFIIPSSCNVSSSKFSNSQPNMQSGSGGSSYYNNSLNNGYNSYSSQSHSPNDCKSLFCGNHQCGETNSSGSSISPILHSQYYGEGIPFDVQGTANDGNFLENLQPGHRLNSEVTIHNISESKFSRYKMHTSNEVEITKIHGPSTIPPISSNPNLHVM